jgi:hypothetical protein
LAVEKEDGAVSIIINFFFSGLYFIWIDRTSSTSGKWTGETKVFVSSVQKSLSQCLRRSSVVFNLFSTSIESIYSCSTMHLLLCITIHCHASQHSLLRSVGWNKHEHD